MCVFVYRFVHVSASALRDQKRALDLLELELSSCETANLSGGDKTWAIYKSIAHSFFLFYFFFSEARTKLGALHLLGKHSTPELNPQPHTAHS